MRGSFFAVSVGMIIAVLGRVEAEMVTLTPLDAQAVTENGNDWTVDTEDQTLNTSRFTSIPLERRAILEFPINGIPDDSVIKSVTISFSVVMVTGSSPVIQFNGYAGDGVLEIADATRPLNNIGASAPITELTTYTVELDPGYLQSQLEAADYLGLLTYQQVVGTQTAFFSVEGAASSGEDPPTLTVEYNPVIEEGGLIPVPDRRDLVWDATRSRLYITTEDGFVERFDADSGILLTPLAVGDSLNGADITPDGAFLYVAEDVPGAEQGYVHKVDLETGTVTTLGYDLDSNETGAWDIGIASNGKALVSTRHDGSAWCPFRELVLSTDTFAVRDDVPSYFGDVRQDTHIHRSADRNTLFMMEPNISNGPIFTYDADADTFPVYTYTDRYLVAGRGAVSRDGSRIALEDVLSIELRTLDLDVIAALDDLSGGVAFDPLLDILYAADADQDEVVAFDAFTRSELFRITINEDIGESQAFGDGVMVISHDGLLLFIATPTGVRMLGVPHPYAQDCNDNGIADLCDVDCKAFDPNTGLPCSAGPACGTDSDCTGNGFPDGCEPDCNSNGVADSCDIAFGPSEDCTSNGIPDECEVDCNENGIADSCDLADGTSLDDDENGIPDECQCVAMDEVKLSAGGDDAQDLFGWSVALSGDRAHRRGLQRWQLRAGQS